MHASGVEVVAPLLEPSSRQGRWRAALLSAPTLVLAYALLSGLLLGLALYHLRDEALRTGERLTGSLAQMIAEQSTRTLQTVDLRLEIATSRLDALEAKGQLSEEAARIVLREQLRDIPIARALWVLDTDGRIVLDSDVGNIGVSMADRAYFQAYKQNPQTGFATGPLVRSRSTGTWLMSATRPWRDASGALRGVVVAAVLPGYFEERWQGIDLGENGAVVLFRRDGQVMVRSPPREAMTGSYMPQLPLFTSYLPRASGGVFTVTSAFDGRERVTAYRVLPQFSELVVTVGSDVSDLLAPWRRLALLSVLSWSLATLVATALGLQLQRQQRHGRGTERRFHQMAQAMPQIVFMSNRHGEAVFVNDRWSEATGRPSHEAMGMGWLAQMHPDDREAATATMTTMMRTGEVVQHEHRLRYADGVYRWQLLRAVPERGPDGKVVSWSGTSTEIDALKQAQAMIQALNAGLEAKVVERTRELAQQEELFRTLAENAPWPIWMVDPRGAVTFLSRAWYDITGGAAPDYHGYDWIPLMHPDDVAEIERNWVEAARSGRAHAGTRRIRSKEGTYHTTLYRALPVRDPQGQISAWVGLDTDITERVAAERALTLANAQLEAFSYSVSHDLRSPLERIGLFAQLLGTELGDATSGKARHYLTRLRANADTMTQLIDGMLALAHVSQMELVRAPVNVSELAAEILTGLQDAQPQRRVRWQVAPGLVVQGDVRLMRSVMDNLLGNAWKFTGHQSAPEIVVGGCAEHGEYFVRDNGAGFDMAYADKLFGTFQRLHREDEFPGTGIGLATVARAISRQGGTIRAEARLGEGATFFFTLPTPT